MTTWTTPEWASVEGAEITIEPLGVALTASMPPMTVCLERNGWAAVDYDSLPVKGRVTADDVLRALGVNPGESGGIQVRAECTCFVDSYGRKEWGVFDCVEHQERPR